MAYSLIEHVTLWEGITISPSALEYIRDRYLLPCKASKREIRGVKGGTCLSTRRDTQIFFGLPWILEKNENVSVMS